ncbi:MAG: hypothetical protein QM720_04605 [Microbacterium sp.]
MVSHADLAAGLKSAVEMVAGPRTDVLALGMQADGGGSRRFEEQLRALLDRVAAADELVVFADLYGGSPLTTTLGVLSDRGLLSGARVFAGANLPMVLTAVLSTEVMDAAALGEEILAASQQGFVDVVIDAAQAPSSDDEEI